MIDLIYLGYFIPFLALVYCVYCNRQLNNFIDIAIHETSRFPLFKARDELVLLIARRQVRADDKGWRTVYGSVNSLLQMEKRLNLLDIIRQNAEYQRKCQKDPIFKKRVKRFQKEVQKTTKQSPQFREVLGEVETGFRHIVRKRTSAFHFFAILLLYLCTLLFTKSLNKAKKTVDSYTTPSTKDIVGLKVSRDPYRSAA